MVRMPNLLAALSTPGGARLATPRCLSTAARMTFATPSARPASLVATLSRRCSPLGAPADFLRAMSTLSTSAHSHAGGLRRQRSFWTPRLHINVALSPHRPAAVILRRMALSVLLLLLRLTLHDPWVLLSFFPPQGGSRCFWRRMIYSHIRCSLR